MSESTIPATAAPAPVPASPAQPPVRARRAGVAAHVVAALVIGSVAPFLVLWTSPAYAFGAAPNQFGLVDVMPQLVALVSLGIALLSRVRGLVWLGSSGWLVAAVGLLGVAGLYAQGNTLDRPTLTLALTAVISLPVVGLLLAFARADGASRWAVAFGLAAGIAGGREAVALLVAALREGPFAGTRHGDDAVFAGLGVLVALAGLVLLMVDRREHGHGSGRWPAAWWSDVRWPVVGLVVASALAVVLTRVANARLDGIVQSHIGGISEEDSLALQTQDQIIRVGIAVLLAALLVAVAQRSGGSAVTRWVLVAFGTGLLLVGMQGFVAYEPSWPTALLALVGAGVGAVLVDRLDDVLPWDALGLALAAGLLVVDAPTVVAYLGVFGAGVALAAGILRLAPPRLGPGGVSVAAALGLAAWVLGHQVVAPTAAFYRTDLGGVPVLPFTVLLAAVAIVAFFLIGRRPAVRG